MSRVLIHNHGARVVSVLLRDHGRVDLAPGANPVDADAWKEIEESITAGKDGKITNPALAAYFNEEAVRTPFGPGHLEFRGAMKGDGPATGTDATAGAATPGDAVDSGLDDYTVEEAKDLIADTLAIEQLRAWRRGEVAGKNRAGVTNALDAQIAKITAPPAR